MYASVGIESPDETEGLQLDLRRHPRPGSPWSFGPGQAIRLTTAPPVRVPLSVALSRQEAQLDWRLDDQRPVIGWRVHAIRDGVKTCVTPEPLPAHARSYAGDVAGADLVLEALLPHGGRARPASPWPTGSGARFALGSDAGAQPHAGRVEHRLRPAAGGAGAPAGVRRAGAPGADPARRRRLRRRRPGGLARTRRPRPRAWPTGSTSTAWSTVAALTQKLLLVR